MIAHSSIVMMLKLGDILSVSGPKLMSQGLWVLRLLGVVIGVGMMELGTSYIRHAGWMTRILLICLHCVHVIVRILNLWLIEMMMWKPIIIHPTNIRKVLTLAVIRTGSAWLLSILAPLHLAIPWGYLEVRLAVSDLWWAIYKQLNERSWCKRWILQVKDQVRDQVSIFSCWWLLHAKLNVEIPEVFLQLIWAHLLDSRHFYLDAGWPPSTLNRHAVDIADPALPT